MKDEGWEKKIIFQEVRSLERSHIPKKRLSEALWGKKSQFDVG